MSDPAPNCHGCRFFHPEDKHGFDDDGTTGTCRRFPPVFLPPMAEAWDEFDEAKPNPDHGDSLEATRGYLSWGWPVVVADLDHWCGEFQQAGEPST